MAVQFASFRVEYYDSLGYFVSKLAYSEMQVRAIKWAAIRVGGAKQVVVRPLARDWPKGF